MTARLHFTELAVRRAVRAARAAGLRVTGITVRPDGTITVHDQEVPVVPGPEQEQHAASSDFEDFQA